MLGSLGAPELIFIFVLALLIFGPRKLPEIGRTIGKGLAEFRKASNDLRRTINAELIEEELRQSDPRSIVRDTVDEVKEVARRMGDLESDRGEATEKKADTEEIKAGEPNDEPQVLEVRRPEGQMARGELVTDAESVPDQGLGQESPASETPAPGGELAPDPTR